LLKNQDFDEEELYEDEQNEEGTVLFCVDIEVRKGQTETLEVYEGDDPQEIATEFCEYFGMNKKFIKVVADQIEQTLEQSS